MRTNLPVTNIEYPIHDDTVIVSKTDPKGKLVYFNKHFVDASGFTEAELMGQPHNIVRHPDMPPEAFEDLWTTIKAGMPWAGAVKNRRKNDDFYWVRASATPIWENGQIAGYMSIRTKLPAAQRAEAEQVYALIRAKKAQKYTVTAGHIRRRSLADSMLRRFKMTVGRKIYALIGLSFIGVVGIALLDSRELASSLDQQKQIELRHMTELALGIVKEEHAAVQNGGVAVADAQKRALARVAALRYGNNDYFWVNDMQPRMARAVARRKADMNKMADHFQSAVGEIIETVSSASTELEASAVTLSSTAERAEKLAIVVAAASEEASTNVQSVASATEEMSSSVNEISRQVQDSARMANEAVDQARTTNDRVGELSKAAARIGDVVELINTIAGQTNLLALNATIEAARAGEAGRGFAVVASEVKALAEQTAKATGEIGQQVAGIQSATQDSVHAIKEISGTIEKLSEISSAIAAAVEEQGAATHEISRNVQQAALGTQQVSSNITDVQRGATETGSASSQVLSAAQSLAGDSNRLKMEVDKFLATVRAA